MWLLSPQDGGGHEHERDEQPLPRRLQHHLHTEAPRRGDERHHGEGEHGLGGRRPRGAAGSGRSGRTRRPSPGLASRGADGPLPSWGLGKRLATSPWCLAPPGCGRDWVQKGLGAEGTGCRRCGPRACLLPGSSVGDHGGKEGGAQACGGGWRAVGKAGGLGKHERPGHSRPLGTGAGWGRAPRGHLAAQGRCCAHMPWPCQWAGAGTFSWAFIQTDRGPQRGQQGGCPPWL